jgi:hypothetical protein
MKALSSLLLATTALRLLESVAIAGATKPVLSHAGGVVPRVVSATPGSVTLYDQTSNDSGVSTVSDDFDSGSFDQYDNQAADDFTVPRGSEWTIKEVDATGAYFQGFGPPDAVNVFFYKNKVDQFLGDLPGKRVAVIQNARFRDITGTGSFVITLSTQSPALGKGTYWVSVQAKMNFLGGEGEWAWENQSTSEGDHAVWRNYGCTTGSCSCTTWVQEDLCFDDGRGDHMFMLKGKSMKAR